MKRVILYTVDSEQAEAEIRSLHGRVTHRISENVIIARLPDDVEVSSLHLSRDASAARQSSLSAIEKGFIEAFHDMESRRASGAAPLDDGLPWDAEGKLAPRSVPAPVSAKAASHGPTSSYMVGRIAVGVVVVSGPGNLKFSDSETKKVYSQVLEGTDFLAGSEPTANVSFDIVQNPVTITAQDNSKCCDAGSYEACEGVWRNPAMAALGYTPDWAGVYEYVYDLQARPGVNWAYAAYFTKYTLCHFAYASLGGPRLVMQYSNDGWGSGNIHRVFAHESCHIFYADDEYKSSGCVCGETSGYFNAPNNNCENCPGSQLKCLMSDNDLQICFWSRRQIGWGGYGQQTEITSQNSAKTSAAPALAEWNGLDYMAFRGASSSNLYLCSYNGTTWGAQSNITDKNGAKTSAGPSLAVFQSKLYMAFRGASSSSIYVCSTSDGVNWSSQTKVTDKNGAKTSATPVLCSYNGKLYMFYRGESSSNFYMCSFDGSKWSSQTKITDKNGAKTAAAPAAAVYQNKIWVTFLGEGGSNLWAFSYNGASFSTQTKITDKNGAKSSAGPALSVLNGFLYMLYRGESSSNLWSCAFNGTSWLEQWKVTDQNDAKTSAQPALAPLTSKGILTAAYRGASSSNLWSCPVYADAPMPASSSAALEVEALEAAAPVAAAPKAGCGCGGHEEG